MFIFIGYITRKSNEKILNIFLKSWREYEYIKLKRSKSYNGRKIIDNFTISISEKSIVSIIGKSGSGKSTILNMIGMLEKVDSGEMNKW